MFYVLLLRTHYVLISRKSKHKTYVLSKQQGQRAKNHKVLSENYCVMKLNRVPASALAEFSVDHDFSIQTNHHTNRKSNFEATNKLAEANLCKLTITDRQSDRQVEKAPYWGMSLRSAQKWDRTLPEVY